MAQPLRDGTYLHGGEFRIVKSISSGGFGITYKCIDIQSVNVVAIKELMPVDFHRDVDGCRILPPNSYGGWTPRTIERVKNDFLREGQLLQTIHHPNVVRVNASFSENDTHYLVMEWVSGKTLAEHSREHVPMPWSEALDLFHRLATPIAHIHGLDPPVYHRDIHPKNFILRDQTNGPLFPVLIDFGLAREGVTYTSMSYVCAYDGYAPPEQYYSVDDQRPLGTFVDVYGLSALLYRLLTGENPIDARDRSSAEMKAPADLVTSVPAEISEAVMRGMALEWSKRPQTVADLLMEFGLSDLPGNGGAPRTIAEYKAQMVSIPGGRFRMGLEDDETSPISGVSVSPFSLGRTPVTVSMFKEFCRDTGRQMPPAPKWGWIDDHPVCNVTWDEADLYCQWAGLMLPTEAEWEYAAKAGRDTFYPWGDKFDQDKIWCSTDVTGNARRTASISRNERAHMNGLGLSDMVGNVSQWCVADASRYQPQGGSTNVRRLCAARGGSWHANDPRQLSVYNRIARGSSERLETVGFRCSAADV